VIPTIDDIEIWVGARLPAPYRVFLEKHAEDAAFGDAILYGRMDFVELNEAHRVKELCPGHVTIGDEGGGRQFLLALVTGRLFLVGADALHPDEAVPHFPKDFASWLAAGCPLPIEKEPTCSAGDLVAVYLKRPPNSLKTLLAIKEHLAIQTSIAELKKCTLNTPCSVAEHLTYMQAILACAKANAVEPCLEIRSLHDPAIQFPLVWQE